MIIKEISKHFWKLSTSYDERNLVFFGQTDGEVLGKYRAYVRRMELAKWT